MGDRYIVYLNTPEARMAGEYGGEGTLQDLNAIFAFSRKKNPSEGSLQAWCERRGYVLYRAIHNGRA
jgi:hypothetical protein